MTRKHVNTKAALAIRQRTTAEKIESDMYVHGDVPQASCSGTVPLNHDYTQMFCFGSGSNVNVEFAGYNDLLPCTVPTLQFYAPPEILEEDLPQSHLLHSFIAAELYDSGVDFAGYIHPFMNDLVADDCDQPLMARPGAEPEFVPVYPRHSHAAFTPPPPIQPFPSNPFGGVQPRPAQSPAHRGLRVLRSKGYCLPRAPPVDTFDEPELNPTRGRKRPLSPDSRARAREVRIMHACGRCHKKRQKCGTSRPCSPCMGRYKRALDLPCMQELPEVRWKRLFTERMYGHLVLSQIQKEMPPPDPNRNSFTLRLHQYFDDPELEIPVVPFVPTNQFHTRKSIFPIGQNTAGLVMQQTEIISPELRPAFSADDDSYPSFLQKFYWSVRRWLDQAEIPDIHWHQIFFRESYGKAWPRAILGDICKFYHDVTKSDCPVLKSCLQTTVLVYMIGHSFYVPREDIHSVMEKIHGRPYSGEVTEWVSPIYVDRFVKTLLLPVYKAGVKASLRGLQELYSPPKPSIFMRDRILASSIVLLIVAASQQGKAIEKALARERQGYEVDTGAVVEQIRDIEHHLVDLIMELWAYKFPPDVEWGSDERDYLFMADRARPFGLLNRFRHSFESSIDPETLRNLPTELPVNIESKKFGVYNTERVLKKFYLVVFPEADL